MDCINKKIAFVVRSLPVNGVTTVVLTLARYYAERMKHDVTIVCLASPAVVDAEHSKIKIVLLHAENAIFRNIFDLQGHAKLLRQCFEQEKFDHIFSFQDKVNMACILTGFSIVVSSHTSLDFLSKNTQQLLFLYNKKNVTRVVALTKKMQQGFSERGIHNTAVIPCSYDEANTVFDAAVSLEAHTQLKQPYFLAVGRLTEQKNFSCLIRAFAQAKCIKNFLLFIVGSGSEQPMLAQLINQLNVQQQVILLGLKNKSELACLYKRAYATVMSSNCEGFSNVLIESLSRGTPVISTDCPEGPSDIINHGENGLLVAIEDDAALRDAMDLVAADKVLYQKLANNAVKSVAHLSVERIAPQWLDLR